MSPPFIHVAWPAAAANFPTVRASAAYDGEGELVTTFPVTLPTGYQVGDLLLLLVVSMQEYSLNTPTPAGWTALYLGDFGANVGETPVAAFYRVATGSEGSTVTITFGSTTRLAGNTYAITGWDASGATADAIAVSTEVESLTGNAPDPASLTPAWGSAKTLWIAASHSSAGSGIAYPANYTGGISGYTGNSTSYHARMSSAWRELETATEDPGAFSLAPSSSQEWHARTIAIKPG